MPRFHIPLPWLLILCLCPPALAEELLKPITPSRPVPPLVINLAERAADPAKDPLPFVRGSWTLAVIPDVQHYNDDAASPKYPKQRAMLQWLVEHKSARNIAMVVTLGDITNKNQEDQYTNARQAFSVLDGQLPYVMTTGNHDYTGRLKTRINDFFKIAQNPLNDPAKGGALGGLMEPDRIENAWYTFTANKQTYLIITVEFQPRTSALEWAGKIVAQHPDKPAILTTHWYLTAENTRYQNPKPNEDRNDGEQMWQKLVRHHPNFIFVINGHVLGKQRGYLASKGDKGNTVHQMLYNRQGKDDGQFRLLEFLPDNRTVHVKTYSPVTDQWDQDLANQYILDLSPGDGPASRPAR